MKKMRVDDLLVHRGLANSVDHARRMILAGEVHTQDALIRHAGELYGQHIQLFVKKKQIFVSRGAEKLKGFVAAQQLQNIFVNAQVLDIGASTGGFTDYALSLGAAQVVCIDVGSNQLAWSLRNHAQVKCLEHTDIREVAFKASDRFGVVLVDVSFMSLRRLWESIVSVPVTSGGHFLLLLKPQFELPSVLVGEGGVVENPLAVERVIAEVKDLYEKQGLQFCNVGPAGLKGRKGNQEYFLHFVK